MPKILDFANRAVSPLRMEQKSSTKAEIVLYAGIGQDWWGDGSNISAKQFSDELKKLDNSTTEIVLRLNSNGGDVFHGITIYNLLRQHKAKVTVYIDGLAASIASVIALAGDEILIGEGAMVMIHLPWTWAMGNRMELENTVGRLMDVEEQILGIYAKRTGLEKVELKAMLEAETWMGADEALEKKFVTAKTEDSLAIAASAFDRPWIARAPKKFNSADARVTAAIDDLDKKIQSRIARP